MRIDGGMVRRRGRGAPRRVGAGRGLAFIMRVGRTPFQTSELDIVKQRIDPLLADIRMRLQIVGCGKVGGRIPQFLPSLLEIVDDRIDGGIAQFR